MPTVADYLRGQRQRAWNLHLAAKAARRRAQMNGNDLEFYRWDLEAARQKAAYDRAGEHLAARPNGALP